MASKIVSISGRPLESVLRITPEQLFHHMRALWVSQQISQNAYFLGNMVLTLMQQRTAATVALSRGQAYGAFVTAPGGQVLSGMVRGERVDFTIALQQLHDIALIMNSKDADDFDMEDAAKRHFTRSPLSPRSSYDDETPIHFRLPKESAEEYGLKVTALFREHFQQGVSPLVFKPS